MGTLSVVTFLWPFLLDCVIILIDGSYPAILEPTPFWMMNMHYVFLILFLITISVYIYTFLYILQKSDSENLKNRHNYKWKLGLAWGFTVSWILLLLSFIIEKSTEKNLFYEFFCSFEYLTIIFTVLFVIDSWA